MVSYRRVKVAKLTDNLLPDQEHNIAVAMHTGELKNPDYDFRNFDSDSKWIHSHAFYTVLCKEPKWMLTADSMRTAAHRRNGTDEEDNGSAESSGNTNSNWKTTTPPLAGVDGRDKAKEKVRHAAPKVESLAAVKEMYSIMKGGHQSLARKHRVDELKHLFQKTKTDLMKLLMSTPKPPKKEKEDNKKAPPVAAIDLSNTGSDDDDNDSVGEQSSLFTQPHSKARAKKPAAAPTTMAPPPKMQTKEQFGISAALSNIMAPGFMRMPGGMDPQLYQVALAHSMGLATAFAPLLLPRQPNKGDVGEPSEV